MTNNGPIHVTPEADLIEHELNDDCPCGPRTDFETSPPVITHHSLDGREKRESK